MSILPFHSQNICFYFIHGNCPRITSTCPCFCSVTFQFRSFPGSLLHKYPESVNRAVGCGEVCHRCMQEICFRCSKPVMMCVAWSGVGLCGSWIKQVSCSQIQRDSCLCSWLYSYFLWCCQDHYLRCPQPCFSSTCPDSHCSLLRHSFWRLGSREEGGVFLSQDGHIKLNAKEEEEDKRWR